ncbi:MAG: ABC transporter ATP-binding protein [Candidatus Omnitrophica bacterium]|nr:ABC transporter ATP-binding protein [Candidatus Omnitrophota bacterium]
MALLKLNRITKQYLIARPLSLGALPVTAVEDINLEIAAGATLGLVGESGCGKSTLARMAVRLIPPSAGEIIFAGEDIARMPERRLRPLRRQFQIVFQDPTASLSPRLTVNRILREPLEAFGVRGKPAACRVAELLRQVNLPGEYGRRYPVELSGGERQRVGIARALALHPRLLVLDEPVASLDISTQAQILNLLVRLQREYRLAYLFIAHDLAVVRQLCDEVAVMYRGSLVEQAAAAKLYAAAAHPYTRLLLSCMPSFRRPVDTRVCHTDQAVPQNSGGCRFAGRCPVGTDLCRREPPQWQQIAPRHWVRCYRPVVQE